MFNFNKSKIQERLEQCLESFKKSIVGLSAKVSPSLLDAIKCEVYGSMVSIPSVANVTVVDAKTLSVKVWDSSAVSSVNKAIQASSLGINPVLEGSTIILPLPPMSKERRNSMVDLLKQNAENAKIAIRNVRRDENDAIKLAQKNKEISEDEQKKYETEVQKLVDESIQKVENIVKQKTEELMNV